MSDESLSITTITPAQASRIFSAVYGRRITAEQVSEIAAAGGLLRADGTMSMLAYVAYLAAEVDHG